LHYHPVCLQVVQGGNIHNSTYCNKVTNGCNSLFCVFISFFTLHVSGSHKPIIRGISSCFFIYNHLVHAVFMLLICVCLWTGLSWWFHWYSWWWAYESLKHVG
jgi:hypothetical protein